MLTSTNHTIAGERTSYGKDTLVKVEDTKAQLAQSLSRIRELEAIK